MKCPACTAILKSLPAGQIEVEACKDGCGGIWLDANELHKFDEPHEFDTHEILELAQKKQAVHIDHEKRKHCPKCEKEPLVRQFLDHQHEIEIDQCWQCGGIWLDVGELNAVRSQFDTYEERSKAANAYIDSHLDAHKKTMEAATSQQLATYHQHTEGRLRAALYALKELLGAKDPYRGHL